MRKTLAVVGLVFAVTSIASAQTKISGSGRCAKPEVQHSIQVPDRPGHVFSISQLKCTWSKPWEIAGVQSKEGVGTVFDEVTGDSAVSQEFYVDTMANGDKAFYRYNAKAALKVNAFQTGEGKWTLVGGTGKLKAINGKGTCKSKGEADGSLAFECEGEYRLPK